MKRKIIGYLSITVGIIADVKLVIDMFFMDYFVSAGHNTMLGLFVIYFILIAGGISLLFKWKNYYILYYIYFMTLTMERIIVYSVYNEHMSILELLIPVTIALPFVWVIIKRDKYITPNGAVL